MNTSPLLGISLACVPLVGLLPLAFGPGQQDVVLTAPQTSAQSARTPAVDNTTVQVYDVKDLVEKLAYPASATTGKVDSRTEEARADLEMKLERYLRNQEEARKARTADVTKKDADPLAADHDGQAALPPRMIVTRDLAELMQHYMKPAFEVDHEQLTVASEGVIVGNLLAEQHAWIKKFVDLQKHTTGVVEIGVTIFEGPRGSFRDAGLKDASSVIENPAALASLCATLQKKDRVNTVTSPRLAVLNGQKASISVMDKVAYIKDWKLTIVEPGPQEIADPTIDVIQDGVVGEFRATALETDVYALDVSFVMSKLERPMATRKIRISATNDKEVEIGVPIVMKVNFESKQVLADGAAAVFTTASPEKDKDLAIVLTLKHRALEAEAK